MKFIAEFQFHKGTIRTVVGFAGLMSQSDFNSIKVRLELKISLSNILYTY